MTLSSFFLECDCDDDDDIIVQPSINCSFRQGGESSKSLVLSAHPGDTVSLRIDVTQSMTSAAATFSLSSSSGLSDTELIENGSFKRISFDPNPTGASSALTLIIGDDVASGTVLNLDVNSSSSSGSAVNKCALSLQLEIESVESTAPCTVFDLEVSPSNSRLNIGETTTFSIVSVIDPGFTDTVNLSLQLESVDGVPNAVIDQDLIDQSILADFGFEPQALNSELTASLLTLSLGEEVIPNDVYTFSVLGTAQDSGEVLCSQTFNITAVSCPTETCTDGSFFVPGESCIPEAEALRSGNLLENPGFETNDFGENFPTAAGGWSGDGVTQVASENGIDVPESSQMLRFDFADVNGSSALAGSEIAQLYVLPNDLKTRIDDGGETITIRQEAFFNRIEGDANTDTEFLVLIIAFDGPTSDFADDYLNRETLNLVRASASVSSDACTNTWEKLGAQIEIPPGTNYIGVVLVAAEDVENDTTGTEFDGHYVDAASLFIVE